MSDLKEEIGKRLTTIRNNLGMKKYEFAEMLGITAQYLGSVENGENCLSVEKLVLLSEKTNLSLDYILLGKNTIDKNMLTHLAQISDEQLENYLSNIRLIIDILRNS